MTIWIDLGFLGVVAIVAITTHLEGGPTWKHFC